MEEEKHRTIRLLVVDDDDAFRGLLKTVLEESGYSVDVASDGFDAVEAARHRSYDLIFLDLRMPGMDGLQALKALRPESPTTDFIIMTAFADVGTAIELIKLGAKEFITKPIEPAEFLARVKSAVRARDAELRIREIQSEFSSRLLHDLRGPLVILSSHLDHLSRTATDGHRNILADMRRQVSKLEALLNDMTDLSLIESGKVHLERLPVNLDVMIPEVCSRLAPQSDAKHLNVTTQMADNIPTLELDPEKIQQVLHNVIDNGIKYTPEGGSITVTLAMGKYKFADKDSDSVEISVTDSGVGISEEDLPLLFDKYKTVLTGKTSAQRTTGLGLTICRSIVEAHGGSIEAESKPGKGTTIRIFLPA